MAEKRMLSKVISISEKVNTLPDIFDMLLFTWMIPHTDDFGRLAGSAAKVKALVVPMLDKTIRDVEAALNHLADAELILWYEADGEKVIQILNNEKHQQGLKGKRSKFAAPNSHLTSNDGYLSASESDIEEMLADLLANNGFIDGDDIISVERQLRIDNSYLDILATGMFGRYLFEIKRQRLSNASIDQILKYRDMLRDMGVNCILIGNGLASNFDLQRCTDEKINVLIYNDSLTLEPKLLFNVKCRQLMLLSNRTEQNRTEQNRTNKEEKEEDAIQKVYRFYQSNFGMISPYYSEQIEKWIKDMNADVVMLAMQQALDNNVKKWTYINKTLNDWHEQGARTVEQCKALIAEFEARKGAAASEKSKGEYEGVRSGRAKATSGSSESEFAFLDKPGRS